MEIATRGDSRRDLLRKMANLIEDVEAANEHALHTDRVVTQQNLHLEHAERLVRAHVSGEGKLGKAEWERAVKLAQPEQHDAPPTECPDCGGGIRHAGFDFHVCDSGCGYRAQAPTPTETPVEGE